MAKAEELFDRLFRMDASIPDAQRALLRSSFIETYNQSPLMQSRMAALEARLASLPPPHHQISVTDANRSDTEFKFFDSNAFLAGRSMQTLAINFDQLKQTMGCNLQTGQVAPVFSPALTIWGHEVAGHAADPNIHRIQDALLANPKVVVQFGGGVDAKKAAVIDSERLRETNTQLSTANKAISIVQRSTLEIEAVKVADGVGREVAQRSGQPFTPREYYYNGILPSYENFLKQFEGSPPERATEVLHEMARQRGISVAEVSPAELFNSIQGHDCRELPGVIKQEMRAR